MDWQPIETAPKDGTWILAFVVGAEIPAVVRWTVWNDEWGRLPSRALRKRWFKDHEDFPSDDDMRADWVETRFDPTHWMPLPDPPRQSE